MLLMRANSLIGQVGGGWALEILPFLGPEKTLLNGTEISPGFECFEKSNYYSGRRVRISSFILQNNLAAT